MFIQWKKFLILSSDDKILNVATCSHVQSLQKDRESQDREHRELQGKLRQLEGSMNHMRNEKVRAMSCGVFIKCLDRC